MEYQIVTLFIIATLNAVFTYFVSRSEKNATNIIFTLITLTVSLWALNVGFFIKTGNIGDSFLFANFYYIAAAAIPLLFLYFSLIFPTQDSKRFHPRYLIYSAPFLLLLVSVLVGGNPIINEIVFVDGMKDVVLNFLPYIAYTIYFLIYVLVSYANLISSYRHTDDKIQRTQLQFVIFGTAAAFLLGMTFNLFLPLIGVYDYIWLGPLFSLVMIFSIGYAIIRHHLFNTKVIAAEALTFALWLFILIRTIIADSLYEQFINGSLFVTTVIFGVFLIRSVIKEVEIREQIEKLAHDLKKANMRLQELDRQKSEFVSIASHQLKSPLTAIKGYASLLLEESFGRLSVKNKEPVQRIFESSVRLVNVIEDFLNITRIEQGRMKFEFQNADLLAMIRDIVKEFEPTIERAGLAVVVRADERKTYTVSADVSKLRQVLSNLTDNAIKYTPKGKIDIEVTKDEVASTITLCVRDTGIGFSPETKVILFQKFGRGDGVEKLHTEGSGIGLYIAREIIRAHKGHIRAESEGLGEGSTFSVELPACA